MTDETAGSPTSALAFCPQCGIAIAADDRFCRGCGLVLVPGAAPAAGPGAVADPAAGVGAIPAVAAKSSTAVKWIAVAAIATVVVVGGWFAYSSGLVGGHEVKGTFALTSGGATSGGSCKGAGGYADIRSGVEVTVKDETGKILATSNLGPGTASGVTGCDFEFTIKVPDAVKFYTFEVGRRGDLSFSHDEMVANGWTVGFTLGG